MLYAAGIPGEQNLHVLLYRLLWGSLVWEYGMSGAWPTDRRGRMAWQQRSETAATLCFSATFFGVAHALHGNTACRLKLRMQGNSYSGKDTPTTGADTLLKSLLCMGATW